MSGAVCERVVYDAERLAGDLREDFVVVVVLGGEYRPVLVVGTVIVAPLADGSAVCAVAADEVDALAGRLVGKHEERHGLERDLEVVAPGHGVPLQGAVQPHEAAGDAEVLSPIAETRDAIFPSRRVAPEAGVDLEAAEERVPIGRVVARAAVVALEVDGVAICAEAALHALPEGAGVPVVRTQRDLQAHADEHVAECRG